MSDEERERWDRRYLERGRRIVEPSPHLLHYSEFLPHTGRALDVAGGDGGNACWLALRGLDVTIVDIAAPGLALAVANAQAVGATVQTVVADLDHIPLPLGPWNVIIDFYYLSRSLIPAMVQQLAPGGYFMWIHPTRRNLERHPRPSARFLLAEGEAAQLIADLDSQDLQIIDCREGWQKTGRHEACVLLRKKVR